MLAFTRGKNQPSQKEVEVSKALKSLYPRGTSYRHAKKIYTILKGTLPIDVFKHSGDTQVANIDGCLLKYIICLYIYPKAVIISILVQSGQNHGPSGGVLIPTHLK